MNSEGEKEKKDELSSQRTSDLGPDKPPDPPDPEKKTEDPKFLEDGIPSLDDIIPWSGEPRKPRQLEVTDSVHATHNINETFLLNVLRSFYSKTGPIPEVRVDGHTHAPMDSPNASQRNVLLAVTVYATIDGKPKTFHIVIKTLSQCQPVRTLSATYMFDKREVGLYTEILDDLDVFQRQQEPDVFQYILVPSSQCLFARHTAHNGGTFTGEEYSIPPDESVVVLENVKHQGYTQTLLNEGLSKDQLLSAIEGVSRLHGLSIAMKERSGIPLRRSYPYLLCWGQATKCIVALFDKNVPDILKLLTTFGAATLREKLMDLRPRLFELIEALACPDEPVSVLAHMNLWAHNILFKDDKCIFVDWQMITCARPTFDLAFLLASSVRANVRRRYTKLFLNHYYEHFTKYALKYGLDVEGDLQFTKERFLQDFRYSQLLALFFCIAKAEDLIVSRQTQLQLIDYLHDLDEQNILTPEIIGLDTPEYVYWMPRNPARSNVIFRIERRPKPKEELDHICGLFPLYEMPEDS